MPLFIKISNDGSEVYLVKTLLSEDINEFTFYKKAKTISTTTFIKSLPLKYRGVMIEKINRVIDLHSLKLSKFGSETFGQKSIYLTSTSIYTGGKVFFEDFGPDAVYHQTQEAINYTKEFYSEPFFKKYGDNLLKEGIMYFQGELPINKEKYDRLTQEHKSLTSLMVIKNNTVISHNNRRK